MPHLLNVTKKLYLVTGSCGFIGSHLVDILMEAGCRVRATDLAAANRRYLPETVDFIPSDLTDPESLKRVVDGVNVVFHPAAIFDFSTPFDILKRVNVDGTEALCRAALAAGVERLVSWSTCGIYGRPGPEQLPITEETRRNPIEDYSRSKLMQDELVHDFHREGLPCTVIRPGVVYGPRSTYGAAQIIEGLSLAPIVPVPFNFDFRMSPVHARDVAGAAFFVSEKEAAAGEEYLVVDSSGATMAEYLGFIAAAMGKPSVPIYVPIGAAAAGGRLAAALSGRISRLLRMRPLIEEAPIRYFPLDLQVSNRKLLDLGYRFEYPDFRLGILETVSWYRARRR